MAPEDSNQLFIQRRWNGTMRLRPPLHPSKYHRTDVLATLAGRYLRQVGVPGFSGSELTAQPVPPVARLAGLRPGMSRLLAEMPKIARIPAALTLLMGVTMARSGILRGVTMARFAVCGGAAAARAVGPAAAVYLMLWHLPRRPVLLSMAGASLQQGLV